MALATSPTPHTRKVAMRMGFTMSPDEGGVFDVLTWLVRRGLGGPFCGGAQFVSWIYDVDLARAVALLLEREDLEGPVNLTAPHPIPNRAFMAELCTHLRPWVALPITRSMAAVGAAWLVTDPELMQKSRRVVPRRLLDAGFTFEAPRWEQAAPLLIARMHGANQEAA